MLHVAISYKRVILEKRSNWYFALGTIQLFDKHFHLSPFHIKIKHL